MSTPFVIMGPPRSGSTLLAHTLNTHPRILCTDEARTFLSAQRAFEPLKARQNYEETWHTHLGAGLRWATSSMYRLMAAEKMGCDLTSENWAWGDKFPHYCDPGWGANILETIERLFPDEMRYVFLTRDKEPCVKSIEAVNKNHKWLNKTAGDIYDDIHREGDRWETIVGTDRFLRLSYEDPLLDNCKRFVDFVHLKWDQTLTDKINKEIHRPTRYSTPTSW